MDMEAVFTAQTISLLKKYSDVLLVTCKACVDFRYKYELDL